MVISDELPTMPGQAQVVLGPDPKLIFICSCVYNFAPSHSSPISSGAGGWAGAEGTLRVRQRVLIPSLEPTWQQPRAQSERRGEVSVKLQPREAWKPPRTEAGKPGVGRHAEKKKEKPEGQEREHRPMSGV